MVEEVAGILPLVSGTHPPIADTDALEVDVDGATVSSGIRFGQVNPVAQSRDVLPTVALAKKVQVSGKGMKAIF